MTNPEAVEAAAREVYATSGRKRVKSYDEAREQCADEAKTILEAAAPHMLLELNAKLEAVRELHSEDIFRGHLSNGCRTCGNVGDVGYPCPTIIALNAAESP